MPPAKQQQHASGKQGDNLDQAAAARYVNELKWLESISIRGRGRGRGKVAQQQPPTYTIPARFQPSPTRASSTPWSVPPPHKQAQQHSPSRQLPHHYTQPRPSTGTGSTQPSPGRQLHTTLTPHDHSHERTTSPNKSTPQTHHHSSPPDRYSASPKSSIGSWAWPPVPTPWTPTGPGAHHVHWYRTSASYTAAVLALQHRASLADDVGKMHASHRSSVSPPHTQSPSHSRRSTTSPTRANPIPKLHLPTPPQQVLDPQTPPRSARGPFSASTGTLPSRPSMSAPPSRAVSPTHHKTSSSPRPAWGAPPPRPFTSPQPHPRHHPNTQHVNTNPTTHLPLRPSSLTPMQSTTSSLAQPLSKALPTSFRPPPRESSPTSTYPWGHTGQPPTQPFPNHTQPNQAAMAPLQTQPPQPSQPPQPLPRTGHTPASLSTAKSTPIPSTSRSSPGPSPLRSPGHRGEQTPAAVLLPRGTSPPVNHQFMAVPPSSSPRQDQAASPTASKGRKHSTLRHPGAVLAPPVTSAADGIWQRWATARGVHSPSPGPSQLPGTSHARSSPPPPPRGVQGLPTCVQGVSKGVQGATPQTTTTSATPLTQYLMKRQRSPTGVSGGVPRQSTNHTPTQSPGPNPSQGPSPYGGSCIQQCPSPALQRPEHVQHSANSATGQQWSHHTIHTGSVDRVQGRPQHHKHTGNVVQDSQGAEHSSYSYHNTQLNTPHSLEHHNSHAPNSATTSPSRTTTSRGRGLSPLRAVGWALGGILRLNSSPAKDRCLSPSVSICPPVTSPHNPAPAPHRGRSAPPPDVRTYALECIAECSSGSDLEDEDGGGVTAAAGWHGQGGHQGAGTGRPTGHSSGRRDTGHSGGRGRSASPSMGGGRWDRSSARVTGTSTSVASMRTSRVSGMSTALPTARRSHADPMALILKRGGGGAVGGYGAWGPPPPSVSQHRHTAPARVREARGTGVSTVTSTITAEVDTAWPGDSVPIIPPVTLVTGTSKSSRLLLRTGGAGAAASADAYALSGRRGSPGRQGSPGRSAFPVVMVQHPQRGGHDMQTGQGAVQDRQAGQAKNGIGASVEGSDHISPLIIMDNRPAMRMDMNQTSTYICTQVVPRHHPEAAHCPFDPNATNARQYQSSYTHQSTASTTTACAYQPQGNVPLDSTLDMTWESHPLSDLASDCDTESVRSHFDAPPYRPPHQPQLAAAKNTSAPRKPAPANLHNRLIQSQRPSQALPRRAASTAGTTQTTSAPRSATAASVTATATAQSVASTSQQHVHVPSPARAQPTHAQARSQTNSTHSSAPTTYAVLQQAKHQLHHAASEHHPHPATEHDPIYLARQTKDVTAVSKRLSVPGTLPWSPACSPSPRSSTHHVPAKPLPVPHSSPQLSAITWNRTDEEVRKGHVTPVEKSDQSETVGRSQSRVHSSLTDPGSALSSPRGTTTATNISNRPTTTLQPPTPSTSHGGAPAPLTSVLMDVASAGEGPFTRLTLSTLDTHTHSSLTLDGPSQRRISLANRLPPSSKLLPFPATQDAIPTLQSLLGDQALQQLSNRMPVQPPNCQPPQAPSPGDHIGQPNPTSSMPDVVQQQNDGSNPTAQAATAPAIPITSTTSTDGTACKLPGQAVSRSSSPGKPINSFPLPSSPPSTAPSSPTERVTSNPETQQLMPTLPCTQQRSSTDPAAMPEVNAATPMTILQTQPAAAHDHPQPILTLGPVPPCPGAELPTSTVTTQTQRPTPRAKSQHSDASAVVMPMPMTHSTVPSSHVPPSTIPRAASTTSHPPSLPTYNPHSSHVPTGRSSSPSPPAAYPHTHSSPPTSLIIPARSRTLPAPHLTHTPSRSSTPTHSPRTRTPSPSKPDHSPHTLPSPAHIHAPLLPPRRTPSPTFTARIRQHAHATPPNHHQPPQPTGLQDLLPWMLLPATAMFLRQNHNSQPSPPRTLPPPNTTTFKFSDVPPPSVPFIKPRTAPGHAGSSPPRLTPPPPAAPPALHMPTRPPPVTSRLNTHTQPLIPFQPSPSSGPPPAALPRHPPQLPAHTTMPTTTETESTTISPQSRSPSSPARTPPPGRISRPPSPSLPFSSHPAPYPHPHLASDITPSSSRPPSPSPSPHTSPPLHPNTTTLPITVQSHPSPTTQITSHTSSNSVITPIISANPVKPGATSKPVTSASAVQPAPFTAAAAAAAVTADSSASAKLPSSTQDQSPRLMPNIHAVSKVSKAHVPVLVGYFEQALGIIQAKPLPPQSAVPPSSSEVSGCDVETPGKSRHGMVRVDLSFSAGLGAGHALAIPAGLGVGLRPQASRPRSLPSATERRQQQDTPGGARSSSGGVPRKTTSRSPSPTSRGGVLRNSMSVSSSRSTLEHVSGTEAISSRRSTVSDSARRGTGSPARPPQGLWASYASSDMTWMTDPDTLRESQVSLGGSQVFQTVSGPPRVPHSTPTDVMHRTQVASGGGLHPAAQVLVPEQPVAMASISRVSHHLRKSISAPRPTRGSSAAALSPQVAGAQRRRGGSPGARLRGGLMGVLAHGAAGLLAGVLGARVVAGPVGVKGVGVLAREDEVEFEMGDAGWGKDRLLEARGLQNVGRGQDRWPDR